MAKAKNGAYPAPTVLASDALTPEPDPNFQEYPKWLKKYSEVTGQVEEQVIVQNAEEAAKYPGWKP